MGTSLGPADGLLGRYSRSGRRSTAALPQPHRLGAHCGDGGRGSGPRRTDDGTREVGVILLPGPVHGVLCVIEADWPLIGGAFSTRGVSVLWPRGCIPRLQEVGAADLEEIARVHHALAAGLSSS